MSLQACYTKRMANSEKVAEAHERLSSMVEAMVSGDDWRAMLAVAAKFHRYSFRNICLIVSQAPEATQVAGYRSWQSMGRQVRKGERGIAILAPCTYRARRDDEETEAAEAPAQSVVRGWRVVRVFDVSQTDGKPLPGITPALLDGEAPEALWERLAALVAEEGYTLERGDCGRANGSTDFATRVVRVRSDVSEAQASKTLAHELAHVLLHGPDQVAGAGRAVAEVEAESVAFVICSAAGLDTDGYSFAYVSHWSGGDVHVVHAAGARVMATAELVLARLRLEDELGEPDAGQLAA